MFGNLFKSIGNMITSPFKSGWNVLSGKGNLGDLLNVGTLFAPGGNLFGKGTWGLENIGRNLGTSSLIKRAGLGALSDPSKANTGDWLKTGLNLAGMSNPGATGRNAAFQLGSRLNKAGLSGVPWSAVKPYATGGVPQTSPTVTPETPKEFGQIFAGLSGGELDRMRDVLPLRYEAQADAYRELDPASDIARANFIRSRLLGDASRTGRANSLYLRNQGYDESTQDAAMLDASNRAESQAGDAFVGLLDPFTRAARYGARADIYDPNRNLPITDRALALANARAGRRQPQPSWIETLLGIGGAAAPYLMRPPAAESGGYQGSAYDMGGLFDTPNYFDFSGQDDSALGSLGLLSQLWQPDPLEDYATGFGGSFAGVF